MMRPTSPRERRLVALLILMALIALVWFALVAPILGGFAARQERRTQLALRYAHNQRVIATIPRVRRDAENQRAEARVFAIDSRNVEAGREWLKARLQRAIENAGGEFREAGDADSPAGVARARASARMTQSQLTATLGQLQNTPPWLIVESLSISANDALVTGRSSNMDVQIEASIPLRPSTAR